MSKTKKILIMLLCLFLLIIGAIGVYAFKVYRDVTNTTDNIYEKVDKDEVRNDPVSVDKGEDPFSVLLLGVDTGDLGRTEQGRSDSIMVVTVNPNTNESKIVSIPRDTYTEIIGQDTTDKINHAYAFGGTAMAVNTVQNLLNIPIDYYIEVNMQGVKDLVDAVGGIDVNSPLEFKQNGFEFTKGPVHLDGEKALAFSRNRYDDPTGDYGRQGRQRQVIEAVVKKAATFSTLTNYKDILNALQNNMKTNLTFDNMYDIQAKYKAAAGNIEQVQMQGTGEMINDISYQIISPDELARVSGILRNNLEL
ncbi:transcriptional regulator [Carnobacterium maltaromaticum]|uniref:LCP family glycopolymer transferase n=1 Tax=Carnobacterium maltaromaticum TaxID=2751 RepID=UPI000C756E78|nr:LCP family protein [Carnobacterium maltaromaticum]PLS36743.1 transcriptional regulator [Carnobacterium maltaromaticum]PLS37558.1 transcriptional regulator [Carnobacterium maltaromaticum]PLS39500.1 transcriptional regulator [Carnobacterium maltaromaticum]PLS44255.1 transcriptional regulator [Carnobacterium maltaromaticum]PLS46289.1 transcriptional regulator [Carnobacterium maltaromaticum]